VLERSQRFDVRVNEEVQGCGPETFAPYDVLVLNYSVGRTQSPWWDYRAREAMLDFVRNGKGLVSVHGANMSFWGWTEYDKLIGGTWRDTGGDAPYHTFQLKFADHDHPITRGLPEFLSQTDEIYHGLTLQPNIRILARAFDDPKNCRKAGQVCGSGQDEPLIWTLNYGAGRVFQTALGHDVQAIRSPAFVVTFQRGTEWAATGQVTLPVPLEMK
jgi:type 1 glutamine amidotransferase